MDSMASTDERDDVAEPLPTAFSVPTRKPFDHYDLRVQKIGLKPAERRANYGRSRGASIGAGGSRKAAVSIEPVKPIEPIESTNRLLRPTLGTMFRKTTRKEPKSRWGEWSNNFTRGRSAMTSDLAANRRRSLSQETVISPTSSFFNIDTYYHPHAMSSSSYLATATRRERAASHADAETEEEDNVYSNLLKYGFGKRDSVKE